MEIYGTLGPACARVETLENMLRLGMTGLRLNLSHRSLRDSSALIEALHEAARRTGAQPKLLIDLQGPELRVGALPQPLELTEGEEIALDALLLPPVVREQLGEGQEILLDDGKLFLRVSGADRALILRGGTLQSRQSAALPWLEICLPALTESDRENLANAREYGVTGVMQPFVRAAEDLRAVRQALNEAGCPELRIFAKIENRAGLSKLPELIEAADEIVIARGDLGNAMPLWELPGVQKRIAAACRAAGRDFMVVTQMLASMEHSAVPTRAEVSDVYNAVLDGAASVMLTGETAAGEHPLEAMRYFVNTVRAAQRDLAACE